MNKYIAEKENSEGIDTSLNIRNVIDSIAYYLSGVLIVQVFYKNINDNNEYFWAFLIIGYMVVALSIYNIIAKIILSINGFKKLESVKSFFIRINDWGNKCNYKEIPTLLLYGISLIELIVIITSADKSIYALSGVNKDIIMISGYILLGSISIYILVKAWNFFKDIKKTSHWIRITILFSVIAVLSFLIDRDFSITVIVFIIAAFIALLLTLIMWLKIHKKLDLIEILSKYITDKFTIYALFWGTMVFYILFILLFISNIVKWIVLIPAVIGILLMILTIYKYKQIEEEKANESIKEHSSVNKNWVKVLNEILQHAPDKYNKDDNNCNPLAKKLKVRGDELMVIISFLEEQKLIEYENQLIVITSKGFEVAMQNQNKTMNRKLNKITSYLSLAIVMLALVTFAIDMMDFIINNQSISSIQLFNLIVWLILITALIVGAYLINKSIK